MNIPESIILHGTELGQYTIDRTFSTTNQVSTYVEAVVSSLVASVKLSSFNTKKDMIRELNANLSNYQIGDEFYIKDYSGYVITGISADVSAYTLAQVASKKLFSQDEDLILYNNGKLGRAVIDFETGKTWYEIDTGIKYTDKSGSGVIEPDCINRIIYSESEYCYYIATTEGLYRSYNNDLTNSKRVMEDILLNHDSVEDPSKKYLYCNIRDIIEIGSHTYLIPVCGASDGHLRYLITDTATETIIPVVNSGGAQIMNGWCYRGIILDDNTFIFTNASTAQACMIKVTIADDRKSGLWVGVGTASSKTLEETWCYKVPTSITMSATEPEQFFMPKFEYNATQYMTELSTGDDSIIFISRHRTDSSSTGTTVYEPIPGSEEFYPDAQAWSELSTYTSYSVPGVFWTKKSEILSGSPTFREVNELSNVFVRQIVALAGKVFVCSGYDNNMIRGHYEYGSEDLQPGLYQISYLADEDDISVENLGDDQAFAHNPAISTDTKLVNIKDIYYSPDINRWLFTFGVNKDIENDTNGRIFFSENENERWTELEYLGFTTGSYVYPKFKETDKIIITDKLSGTISEAIISFKGNNQIIANLDDIHIRNMKLDGSTVSVDNDGTVDIALNNIISAQSKTVINEMLPSQVSSAINEQTPKILQKSLKYSTVILPPNDTDPEYESKIFLDEPASENQGGYYGFTLSGGFIAPEAGTSKYILDSISLAPRFAFTRDTDIKSSLSDITLSIFTEKTPSQKAGTDLTSIQLSDLTFIAKSDTQRMLSCDKSKMQILRKFNFGGIEIDPMTRYFISSCNKIEMKVAPNATSACQLIENDQTYRPIVKADIRILSNSRKQQKNDIFYQTDPISFEARNPHDTHDIHEQAYGSKDDIYGILIDTTLFEKSRMSCDLSVFNAITLYLRHETQGIQTGELSCFLFEYTYDYDDARNVLTDTYCLTNDIQNYQPYTDMFETVAHGTIVRDGWRGYFNLVDSNENPIIIKYAPKQIYALLFSGKISGTLYISTDDRVAYEDFTSILTGNTLTYDLMKNSDQTYVRYNPCFALSYYENSAYQQVGRQFMQVMKQSIA